MLLHHHALIATLITLLATGLDAADAARSAVINPVIGAASPAEDWRCFDRALPVLGKDRTDWPPFTYVEGLNQFAISEQVVVQTVHVAREHEGDPSQHIIARRSLDAGRTWGEWFDVEPEGPPMSARGSFVRHPKTGRLMFIYTYGPAYEDGKGLSWGGKPPRPVPMIPHHVGHAAFRYVDDQGRFAAERHLLALPQTAIDRGNVFKGEHVMFYTQPMPRVVAGDDGYGWYVKLGPRLEVNSGELFFVKFHGYAHDDRLEKLPISLLPAADRGLRGPGSLCIADVAPLFLDDRHWLFTFRTTSGYAGYIATHDLGVTAEADHLRYEPKGRPVKNPEGPLVVTRDDQGRVFLGFYNSSFRARGAKGRGSRDQVFLSHVRIADGRVSISQPELFHYRADQSGAEADSIKRLNCPAIRATPEGLVGQGSDKTGVRRFAIPPAFLDALAGQWTASGIPAHGLIAQRPGPISVMDAPHLPDLSTGGGWSISFSLKLAALTPGQTVLDGWQGDGGVKIVLGVDRSLVLTMSDGTRTAIIASDPDALIAGPLHHITITADGMPALLSMVVDGRLQDGGAARDRGTVWFDHAFTTPVAKARWTVGSDLTGVVSDVFVHERFLLTSEAVALHRHRMHER